MSRNCCNACSRRSAKVLSAISSRRTSGAPPGRCASSAGSRMRAGGARFCRCTCVIDANVSVHGFPMKKVPALELRKVSYALDGRKILAAVDWRVRPGEHWAILGPNGSGKTTLLRIACGFLWPNAGGEVRRNGETLVNLPELRRSIGWVTASLAAEI